MIRLRRVLGMTSAIALAVSGVVLAQVAQAVPAGAEPVTISCGATINADTTLSADVGPCPSTAITLGANHITLNLNGHIVKGPNLHNGDTPGIMGGANGVSGDTVENGTVTGFDSGVFFQLGGHNTVSRIYAHDNIGPPDGNNIFGEGIQLFMEHNDTIVNNQVVHNGPFAGIDAYDVSNTTIASNTVVNNNVLEPTTTHCGSPDGCMQDIGIWVVFLSIPTNGNVVTGNTVINSGLDGIQLSTFTTGNTVTHNTVSGNGFGQVVGPRDGDGIVIFGTHATVEWNTASKNAAKGIRVINSLGGTGSFDTVEFNTAEGNGGGINSAGKSFDLADTNTGCGTDTWHHNVFTTINQPCVGAH